MATASADMAPTSRKPGTTRHGWCLAGQHNHPTEAAVAAATRLAPCTCNCHKEA